jgi:hypothetical protein
MALLLSNIKFYRSMLMNDSDNNGGRLSSIEEPSGLEGSLWPHIDDSDITFGRDQFRKLFLKVNNADNAILNNVMVGLYKNAPGDVKLFLLPGTQEDTQDSVSSTLYGGGNLSSNAVSGSSTVSVIVEDGSDIVFRQGDKVVITNRETPNGVGHNEFFTISDVPSISGDIVTISLNNPLNNNYFTSNSYLMSLIDLGTISSSLDIVSNSSSLGVFSLIDATAFNIGGVHEEWTFEFSNATTFSCTGDSIGLVGSGNIGSVFSPVNPGFNSPYFSILPSCWSGSFLSGDTVVVQQTPAAKPYWERRIIPIGASNTQSFNRVVRWYANV